MGFFCLLKLFSGAGSLDPPEDLPLMRVAGTSFDVHLNVDVASAGRGLILRLNQGERLFTEALAGSRLRAGEGATSFSGFLLYPDEGFIVG